MIGLSLGLTCCIVVGVFVSTEFQFDTHHEHPDRIYRVLRKKPRSEGNLFYSRTCAAQLAPTLRQEYAEVETSVRTFNRFSWIEVDGKGFNALVCLTEPSIFDVFSYEFVQGKPSDLETPYTAFITESLASRVFGAADPIGQTIYVDYKWGVVGDFTVVGILEDMPRTSSFATRFDFITTTIPPGHLRDSLWSRWPPVTQNTHPFNTFVVLRPDADPAVLEAKLPAIIERHYGGEALKTNSYHLQPLLRMNLYSREDYGFDSGSNDISTVRVFFAIGMLILLVACANYINLATAQASQRAREVGVRKCVGARRHQMVWQFIGESVLLVAIAMVLALSIVGLTLPALGSALGQRFTMDAIDSTWLIGGSILLPIVVGTIAGTYPALYLTRVQAVDALKSKGLVVETDSGRLPVCHVDCSRRGIDDGLSTDRAHENADSGLRSGGPSRFAHLQQESRTHRSFRNGQASVSSTSKRVEGRSESSRARPGEQRGSGRDRVCGHRKGVQDSSAFH